MCVQMKEAKGNTFKSKWFGKDSGKYVHFRSWWRIVLEMGNKKLWSARLVEEKKKQEKTKREIEKIKYII